MTSEGAGRWEISAHGNLWALPTMLTINKTITTSEDWPIDSRASQWRCCYRPPPPLSCICRSGINAPGLRALAAAMLAERFCIFSVSAPAGERSAQVGTACPPAELASAAQRWGQHAPFLKTICNFAQMLCPLPQSHSISIGKHLHAFEIPVEGAVSRAWDAYASGRPWHDADKAAALVYNLTSPCPLLVRGPGGGLCCRWHARRFSHAGAECAAAEGEKSRRGREGATQAAASAAGLTAAPLLPMQNPAFDLVVSGINRGDNCGCATNTTRPSLAVH